MVFDAGLFNGFDLFFVDQLALGDDHFIGTRVENVFRPPYDQEFVPQWIR